MMANIELGVLKDGGVMLVCDRQLPQLIKRVEYYEDQRLFMLVYHDDSHEGDLMPYELPVHLTEPIQKTPDVIIYMMFQNEEPLGYKVPLIKVHN